MKSVAAPCHKAWCSPPPLARKPIGHSLLPARRHQGPLLLSALGNIPGAVAGADSLCNVAAQNCLSRRPAAPPPAQPGPFPSTWAARIDHPLNPQHTCGRQPRNAVSFAWVFSRCTGCGRRPADRRCRYVASVRSATAGTVHRPARILGKLIAQQRPPCQSWR
jgi:hypothetical protein